MREKIIIILLSIFLITSYSFAELGDDEKILVPKGAKVVLELDKQEYYFGENILLHFCLENESEENIPFNIGHDYQGSSRALRYKVTAKDKEGNIMADPDIFQDCMGGLGNTYELKPGERWCESLPLMRYVYCDKSGQYTIEAYHDFGWKETQDLLYPKGKITIQLLMPSEGETKALIEQMKTLPSRDDYTDSGWGKKRKPYRDYAALSHPIYLPFLLSQAKQKDEDALEALIRIPTANATKALIDLLDNDDPDFVLKVFNWGLERRIPDPSIEEYLRKEGINKTYYNKIKNWVGQVWRDEFSSELVRYGKKFLQSDNSNIAGIGGKIMKSLGKSSNVDELGEIVSSLDKVIEEIQNHPIKYPNFEHPAWLLVRSLERLMTSDTKEVNLNPMTLGEITAYIIAVKQNKEFRPAGWENYIKQWLKHKNPFIREIALTNLPDEILPEVKNIVIDNLQFPDECVQIAASEKAVMFEITEAKDAILENLKTTKNLWVMRSMFSAAFKLKLRWDTLNILIDKLGELDESGAYCDIMGSIARLIIDDDIVGGSCSKVSPDELNIVKVRLKKFLKENEVQLRADRGFHLYDEQITPDLFLKYSIVLSDKSSYPPIKEVEKNDSTYPTYPATSGIDGLLDDHENYVNKYVRLLKAANNREEFLPIIKQFEKEDTAWQEKYREEIYKSGHTWSKGKWLEVSKRVQKCNDRINAVVRSKPFATCPGAR